MDEDEEFEEEKEGKEEKEEKDEKGKDTVRGLKQITAKVENCGESLGDVNKDDKYFMYSFPSINQIDLEMKMEDFP